MPGGDGTGPLGLGPMTGCAAGDCAGYAAPGYANPVFGRGRGFGRGWGRGRGGWRRSRFGYGPAWGYPYGTVPYCGDPYTQELTPQQEADVLKKEVKAFEDEINSINQRISELESEAKAAKK